MPCSNLLSLALVLLLIFLATAKSLQFEHAVVVNGVSLNLQFNPFTDSIPAIAERSCMKVREFQHDLSSSCSEKVLNYLHEQLDIWFRENAEHRTDGRMLDTISVGISFYSNSFIGYTQNLVGALSYVDSIQLQTLSIVTDKRAVQYENLYKQALIASVGASTRIEGSNLSDKQVAHLLEQMSPPLTSRSEEEVLGLAETIQYMHSILRDVNEQEFIWTEELILTLHEKLLKYSNKDQRHKGRYKTVEINVNAYNEFGEFLAVVMESTPAALTPQQVKELLNWYNRKVHTPHFHPLVRIAVFTVTFLKIHPFEDGNGRLSRLITDAMLLQSGYTFTKYVALSPFIELSKMKYYQALRDTQVTLTGLNPDWSPFLEYFLYVLKLQAESAKLLLL